MKRLVAALVVIVLIVIGVLAFKGNDNQGTDNSQTNANQSSSQSPSSGNQSPAQPVANNVVIIQNFAFSPASITVKKGTKVTWTNQDSTAHTVTETDGKTGPSSSPLDQGQTYSFTYNET